MAKQFFGRNVGMAFRCQRNSMKYGQSWDAEAQSRHNRKRRVGILTPAQELAETVKRQKELDKAYLQHFDPS